MAYMCRYYGECDCCGACWDEDDNEAFDDEEEYRPEDDWEESEQNAF